MVSTSLTNPGQKINIHPVVKRQIEQRRNSTPTATHKYESNIAKRNRESVAVQNKAKSQSNSGNPNQSQSTSSGSGITTEGDSGEDVLLGGGDSGDVSGEDTSGDSSSTSGATSPLLSGDMTFEELIGEICDGLDLIFAVKRSTIVITDYENLYAEAKYLRDKHHSSVKAEDMALWQLEEGTYELDVAEYGFYNTVKVHYKKGTVTESYDDLVRVYGESVVEYNEPDLDKSSAIMKAKAYLAAHVRDFDMTVKATVLHDGDIDIGDIVTLENPMTMRDAYRKNTEGRDPEYFFVSGNSISWSGDDYIKNDIEMRYGAESPQKKDVPETGTAGYVNSETSSGNVDSAIDEVGKMAGKITYSRACQTHDCVLQQGTGDCFGMSDFIACELISRGVAARIRGYPTYVPEHRSVQYKDASGQWVNFPYRKYGCDSRFNDTSGVKHSHGVKCTCEG